MKTFYRIANNKTKQGLWYDQEGKFTGLIHDKFDFCTNSELPMPFNKNIIGWLSATDSLEDLYNWFSKEDIFKLQKHGYYITVYSAKDYTIHENHYLILQDTSVVEYTLNIQNLVGAYKNPKWLAITLKIISLPFVMCLFIISLAFMFLKMSYFHLKYGGEFIQYTKDHSPATIGDMMNLLKEKL